jgi:Zinc-binding loop region of homing endonuclease
MGKDPNIKKWQDASHLCHKPNCFNKDHLEWESHQLNLDRRNCMVWIGLGACEGCGLEAKKVLICGHGERENKRMCVKFCAGFDSHKDFEARGIARPKKEVLEQLASAFTVSENA